MGVDLLHGLAERGALLPKLRRSPRHPLPRVHPRQLDRLVGRLALEAPGAGAARKARRDLHRLLAHDGDPFAPMGASAHGRLGHVGERYLAELGRHGLGQGVPGADRRCGQGDHGPAIPRIFGFRPVHTFEDHVGVGARQAKSCSRPRPDDRSKARAQQESAAAASDRSRGSARAGADGAGWCGAAGSTPSSPGRRHPRPARGGRCSSSPHPPRAALCDRPARWRAHGLRWDRPTGCPCRGLRCSPGHPA